MKDYHSKIKEKFGEKEFTIEDLSRFLSIKKSSAYWVIYNLKENNLITQPMRGTYKLSAKKTVKPDKEIEKIRLHLLNKMARIFSFTGLSILESFVHHIPFVLIYHLYVEPGSAEDFKTEVSKVSGMHILIRPTSKDIALILDNLKLKKLLIIRENTYFYSSKEGLSSKEAAFIDLYFEVTRDDIPFIRTDLEEIFKSLAAGELINYSTLLKYAKLRGLREEIKGFLKGLSSSIHIPEKALS